MYSLNFTDMKTSSEKYGLPYYRYRFCIEVNTQFIKHARSNFLRAGAEHRADQTYKF